MCVPAYQSNNFKQNALTFDCAVLASLYVTDMYKASSVTGILASLYHIKLKVFPFAGISSHFLLYSDCNDVTSTYMCSVTLSRSQAQADYEAPRSLVARPYTLPYTSISVTVAGFESARCNYSSNASSYQGGVPSN